MRSGSTRNSRKRMHKGDGDHCNPTMEEITDDKTFILRFEALFNTERFSDVILKVGDDRYFAHKFILKTHSDVFEVMLATRQWCESSQDEVNLVEEAECMPVFADFLKYMYTGRINFTSDTVLPIMLLSDKYGIGALRESCVKYMQRHIVSNPDTNRTLTWYQHAKLTRLEDLQDSCTKYIVSNFDIIMKTGDWLLLTKGEMMEFLNSSEIVVQSEHVLWEYIEKWLTSEVRKDTILEDLQDVLPLLRFTLIPPKYLLMIESRQLYIDHTEAFAEKMNSAYRYHSLSVGCEESTVGRELYRNYLSGEYSVCHSLDIPSYLSVGKVESKMTISCAVPQRYIAQTQQKEGNNCSVYKIEFYPKGYFSKYSIYGSYLGRQTDSLTLRIAKQRNNLPPTELLYTFIVYGKTNGIKYVALSYSGSHVFSKDCCECSVNDMVDMAKLSDEESPYLINGLFQSRLFLKLSNVSRDDT